MNTIFNPAAHCSNSTADQSPTRWAVIVTRTRQVQEKMTIVGTMPTVDELVDGDQSPVQWIAENYESKGEVTQPWQELIVLDVEPGDVRLELLNDRGDVLDTSVLG